MTIFGFFALSKAKPRCFQGPLWRNPKFMAGDLKKKIQEERENDSLAGVGAHIIVLWEVRAMEESQYGLLAIVPAQDGNLFNVKPKHTLPGEELDPTDMVLTVFPEQPPLDRLHIIIIVRKQDTGE
jgi:hypothetical protein